MRLIANIFWNENERRIRVLWRLTAQLLLWLTITIILLLVVRATSSAVLGFSVEESVSFELAIGFVGTLLAVWLAGWGLDKRPFTDFGLRINKAWWIDFGFGLFLGGFLIALVFLIELAAGWVEITGTFVTSAPKTTFGAAFASSIGIFILASVQEELHFRGYILTNLAEGFNGQRIGPRWALIIATLFSAGIFSLMHLSNNHASLNSTISAFLGGIILTLGYLFTGELALSIGFHITWNAFQNSVFGFPVSGEAIATATLVQIRQTGPAAWVGDAFGPESGLLVIGAVALGCALIMLWVCLRYGRIVLHTSIAVTSTEGTFMMKKSYSLIMFVLIIILSILWLGSSGCTTPQPTTEVPQVEEQATGESPTNTPLQPTATPIPPTDTPPESGTISLQAPLGNAAIIDGTFSPGEWDGALTAELANGGELALMHNDGYLYLGIRSRAMGFGSICTADGNRVSILHSSAGLGTAVFERDGDDWRRTQQFSYCCWEAPQSRLDTFLLEEGWVASIGPKGIPEEMEYKIAMNDGSLTLAVVYVDDFSFETALHWPNHLADDCLELALVPEDPPEGLSFSPATWATITAPTPRPDSESGMIAFTSAQDGNMEIYLIDVAGVDPRRLTDHPGEDYWPTWSPDGAQIAFASERDGDFEIYTMNADRSNLRRLTHEPGNDLEPDWSPDGAKIVFMVYDGGKSDVYVMNADGSERRPLTNSDGDHYLPQWSPDSAQIVFVSERDGNPEIYVMNADGSDQQRLTDNPGDDRYPSWSPDGRQITFYSERDEGRELYVMDSDGRNPRPLTHDNASVWVSDWSPDGRIVFTSNRDGNREIYIMDADGGSIQRLTNNNVLDGIPAWRPVAAETATAATPISFDRVVITLENAADVVQLWQTEMPGFLDLHETCGVAFSPDGKYLAAACRSPLIPLWEVATGQFVHTFGGGGYVWTNVAFSPDGETLASSGQENAISLWDVVTGELVRKIKDAPGYMSEIAFSPDGKMLASGSFLGSAMLWDVAANDALLEFLGHHSRVNCINFSPGGNLLVTGGGDNKARVWQTLTGEEILVLSGATHFIEDVEFAPDGRQIVGASDNSRIYLWDAANGNLLQTFRGHSGPVNGVTYSPDGRLLASASNDRTLRLWDVNSGENLAQLTGHTDLAIRPAFNPAGSLIASISWDGTVRLWGLPGNNE